MKIYILLAGIQSEEEHLKTLQSIELILNDRSFLKIVNKYNLITEYLDLDMMWNRDLKKKLSNKIRGSKPTLADIKLAKNFISHLEYIIKKIEKITEQKIIFINSMLKLFSVIVVFFSFIAIYSLNKRFFKPWSDLLHIAKNIQLGHSDTRFDTKAHSYRDEMWELGHAFNNMSETIKNTYDGLEKMVADKTTILNRQNLHLAFLYRCCKLFQNQELNCQVLAPFMKELLLYTGVNKIFLFIYDPHKLESKYCHNRYIFGDSVKPAYCSSEHCKLCIDSDNTCEKREENWQTRTWDINNISSNYGYIEFYFSQNDLIHPEVEQLILAFCNLLSQSLSLSYKEQQQQQLMLLKERNSIAQTLHDSIAQSLSYLKIKISILQRDSRLLESAQGECINEMRSELNEAYSNLRTLIATFRMPYRSMEIFVLLKDLISSFNDFYGFNVSLEYKNTLNDYSKDRELFILSFFNEILDVIKTHVPPSRVDLYIQTLKDNVMIVIKGEEPLNISYESLVDYLLQKKLSFSNEWNRIEINLNLQ